MPCLPTVREHEHFTFQMQIIHVCKFCNVVFMMIYHRGVIVKGLFNCM